MKVVWSFHNQNLKWDFLGTSLGMDSDVYSTYVRDRIDTIKSIVTLLPTRKRRNHVFWKMW